MYENSTLHYINTLQKNVITNIFHFYNESYLETNEGFTFDNNKAFRYISLRIWPCIKMYCSFHDRIIKWGATVTEISRLFEETKFKYDNKATWENQR